MRGSTLHKNTLIRTRLTSHQEDTALFSKTETAVVNTDMFCLYILQSYPVVHQSIYFFYFRFMVATGSPGFILSSNFFQLFLGCCKITQRHSLVLKVGFGSYRSPKYYLLVPENLDLIKEVEVCGAEVGRVNGNYVFLTSKAKVGTFL